MSFLAYKNIKIHFSVEGKGRAIVLLHGFLEDSGMWNEISKELSKKFRVVTIDLLGHGKTENLSYVHTMEEQATMVKFVLDKLKLRKYILVGHSMGGYVSLAFAEVYPNNLKGICLMNSTAIADSKEKQSNRDRAIEAAKYNPDIFIKMAIPNLFAEKNRLTFKKEIEQITLGAIEMSKQGIIAALDGMKIRKDRSFLFKTLPFPILLILGKKDPVLDYKSMVTQTRNTPVTTVEFDDGHMSHIENKNDLLKTIKDFAHFCLIRN